MAAIQKREGKNGVTYRVQVRVQGLPPQTRTFKRLTDAKTWAQQTEAAVHRGDFRPVHQQAKKHTLKAVIDRYRREELPHRAASTQRAMNTYLKHWEQELGDYALSHLTAELIAGKVDALAKAGDARRKPKRSKDTDKGAASSPRPKSRKTVKLYRDALELLLKHAKQWGLLGANPMDGVSRVTKLRNARTRYLSDEERDRLLRAAKASDNKQLYPIVAFALATGARKGEITGLKLPDLNLEQGSAILRDTKNGETRSVPVVDHLKEALSAHLEWRKQAFADLDPPTPWLFPRRDGQQPIDIRKAWENARDAAKLEDFRFHDLRHSTASYLAMNGASLLEIAAVLGHKTLQMVQRYAHLSDDHTRDIVTRMNEKIFQE